MGWRRVLYLGALAGCLVFYAVYRQWLAGLVLTAVLALPVFSLLMSLPALITTDFELKYPRIVSKGEKAAADIWVCCNFPVPPAKGKLRITRATTGDVWYNVKFSKLPTNHCGQLLLESYGGWVYDYLGLFRRPARKVRGTVLVRPEPVAIDPPPDLSCFQTRRWLPKRGGGFGENHELRLYRPGDNLQQIHWKLTAKTGKLILRETVEPERRPAVIKLELMGKEAELDRKLGQLLWLSRYLLSYDLHHEIRALTGKGLLSWQIREETDTQRAVDDLLQVPCAGSGTISGRDLTAGWEYYIGGGTDEA